MQRDQDEEWGVRLADVRVPSWYGLCAVLLAVAALVSRLRERRVWSGATANFMEAAQLLAERMVEGDRRDDRVAELTESMAAMTKRMERYGRLSVLLATASLLVAVAALAVAVVFAVGE